ncbi:MAG TPA: hypothetical protein VLS96_20375, partial [Nodosilinea sp.]|nr:hypothetical protein [Nodosilinea sp.]
VEPPTEPVDGIFRVWTSPSDPIAQAEPVTDEAVAAQAVADEAVAAAPAEEAAPQTDRLAALWQTTVDRFSDSFTSTGTGQTPQTASIAGLLFNGNSAVPPAPSATEVATAEVAPAEVAPEPQPAAIAPTDAAEGHAPPALEPAIVQTLIEAPAADPVALTEAEAEASSSPTWAAAREGHQSTPAPQAEAVPGAFPDSTVFAPASQSPEAVPELSPEAEPQPEPAEPAAAGPVAPEAEAAAPEVPAPEAQSEQPAAEPASAETSATQPEPEPAASDILGFAPANADDLLPKPALAAEAPMPTVEPVPAAAAIPLASQPADPAADPAAPAQGIGPTAPGDEPAQ